MTTGPSDPRPTLPAAIWLFQEFAEGNITPAAALQRAPTDDSAIMHKESDEICEWRAAPVAHVISKGGRRTIRRQSVVQKSLRSEQIG
jgi:hypothetical protein